MDVILQKKLKCKYLIEGFPGFGLIGTIATEYLIEHLDCKKIGEFVYDELNPTVAIHKGKVVHPMGIYYSKKFDLVILHAILDIKGFEWKIVDAVEKIIKQLGVKEIISIEGVSSNGGENIYCYQNKSFEKFGAEVIKESVIMGVTAGLLVRGVPVSCLFAETHSAMPDSRAAAKILELLNKYLKFNLDTQPLLLQAEIFEGKVKDIMKKTSQTTSEAEKKQMSYLG